MKTTLAAAALAAALACTAPAGAAVLGFGSATPIDIDPVTNDATYLEAGYAIRGPAASFLPLDDGAGGSVLVGGFDTTAFQLQVDGSGSFSLLGLDLGFPDFGFGTPPGVLTVTGWSGGATVATRLLDLAAPGHVDFGAAWRGLDSVSFSASSGFSLDNVAVVPEPSTYAMATLGLLLIGAARWRRQRVRA